MEKKCTTGTKAKCEVVNERKCETVEDEVCTNWLNMSSNLDSFLQVIAEILEADDSKTDTSLIEGTPVAKRCRGRGREYCTVPGHTPSVRSPRSLSRRLSFVSSAAFSTRRTPPSSQPGPATTPAAT